MALWEPWPPWSGNGYRCCARGASAWGPIQLRRRGRSCRRSHGPTCSGCGTPKPRRAATCPPRCRCRSRARPRRPELNPPSRARTAVSREAARRGRKGRREAGTAAALGLPAGADRRDRDRPQHPRHQGRRRLRRRGSGAAGGGGAAGQAAGFGEAGGDPALRDGERRSPTGSAPTWRRWPPASAAASANSTISTRSNAAAATAWPAPGCPSTAAPTRSTFAPSSSPTASRSR